MSANLPPCELVDELGVVSVVALSTQVLSSVEPVLAEGLRCGAQVQVELNAVRAELARRRQKGIKR